MQKLLTLFVVLALVCLASALRVPDAVGTQWDLVNHGSKQAIFAVEGRSNRRTYMDELLDAKIEDSLFVEVEEVVIVEAVEKAELVERVEAYSLKSELSYSSSWFSQNSAYYNLDGGAFVVEVDSVSGQAYETEGGALMTDFPGVDLSSFGYNFECIAAHPVTGKLYGISQDASDIYDSDYMYESSAYAASVFVVVEIDLSGDTSATQVGGFSAMSPIFNVQGARGISDCTITPTGNFYFYAALQNIQTLDFDWTTYEAPIEVVDKLSKTFRRLLGTASYSASNGESGLYRFDFETLELTGIDNTFLNSWNTQNPSIEYSPSHNSILFHTHSSIVPLLDYDVADSQAMHFPYYSSSNYAALYKGYYYASYQMYVYTSLKGLQTSSWSYNYAFASDRHSNIGWEGLPYRPSPGDSQTSFADSIAHWADDEFLVVNPYSISSQGKVHVSELLVVAEKVAEKEIVTEETIKLVEEVELISAVTSVSDTIHVEPRDSYYGQGCGRSTLAWTRLIADAPEPVSFDQNYFSYIEAATENMEVRHAPASTKACNIRAITVVRQPNFDVVSDTVDIIKYFEATGEAFPETATSFDLSFTSFGEGYATSSAYSLLYSGSVGYSMSITGDVATEGLIADGEVFSFDFEHGCVEGSDAVGFPFHADFVVSYAHFTAKVPLVTYDALTCACGYGTSFCDTSGNHTVTCAADGSQVECTGCQEGFSGAACDVDEVLPVVTCPSDVFVTPDNSSSTVVATFGVATVVDNNPMVEATYSHVSGGHFAVGTTTVTVTADDGTQAGICTFDVVVEDVHAPSISCADSFSIDAEAGANYAMVSYKEAVVIENGLEYTLEYSHSTDTAFLIGENVVRATATDAAGLSNSCEFIVTVVDAEAPVFVCEDVVVYALLGTDYAPVKSFVNATDNDIDGVAIVYTFAQDEAVEGLVSEAADVPAVEAVVGDFIGTTAVVATAVDASGNEAVCEFNVVVVSLCESMRCDTPGVCETTEGATCSGGMCSYPMAPARTACTMEDAGFSSYSSFASTYNSLGGSLDNVGFQCTSEGICDINYWQFSNYTGAATTNAPANGVVGAVTVGAFALTQLW